MYEYIQTSYQLLELNIVSNYPILLKRVSLILQSSEINSPPGFSFASPSSVNSAFGKVLLRHIYTFSLIPVLFPQSNAT